jgi:ribosome-associated translation inhibitor RaiA
MSLHTNKYQGVKLSVQSKGIRLNDRLQRRIHRMIKKLRKHLPGMNWIDVYLKTTQDVSKPKLVTVRFGIPGPDIVASDSGSRWKTLLKNIEKRIMRQLEKRKLSLNAVNAIGEPAY